ncbi:hypothetical protein EI976_05295 [Bacillus licheniformis]|uniref:hypothetical protein n=1 Tax=Bacillus licheniformis TaxID=1402 RepID=UPI0002D47906|nr:hypothetical protein [Bacillus licheniformis]AYC51954.1 hypothetical protein C7M53_11885 [Bacillus licheniformis]KAA0813094.1 hypothetical protein EI978_08015 [Bacillus licheniformis]KAA0821283.1 hypothetical protein EI973_19025 [Bacillus licheniformis]KAA0826457.1 hypothetical protein EI976_05295 [Bacillus licheniformis]MBU8781563.1 hypothetical protein [Bacillus licheniformis]
MGILKKIIIGFLLCHVILLTLLYFNLYIIGAFDEWNNTFIYAAIIFSYIPAMALIEYFVLSYMIRRLNLNFIILVVLVSFLTALVNSIFVYFQSNEIYMASITAISTLIMSSFLSFMEKKEAH